MYKKQEYKMCLKCKMFQYIEIAEKLCISERTVESHRTNIMAKLELRSRAELVRFAIDNGMLKLY